VDGTPLKHLTQVIAFSLFAGILAIRGGFSLEPSAEGVGSHALIGAFFSLFLLGLILILAAGLGLKLLRFFHLEDLTTLELTVFTVPIGLGVLAYGILALGLIGYLRLETLVGWLLLTAFIAHHEWQDIIQRSPSLLRRLLTSWQRLSRIERTFFLLAGGILVVALLNALTPPWGYDALMYHLQAPRLFLAAGRIHLLPEIWQANGPLTLEMLYTLGLALGSDVFAKLLHLTFGVWMVLATYGFARRFLGNKMGWLAAAVLLSMPALPFWSAQAYADLAWALYSLLAIYVIALWQERQSPLWLILSGAMMGWALGCKYLALGGWIALVLWLMWDRKSAGLHTVLRDIFVFSLVALLIGSPWYIKNWLLSGNPLYPFLGGGPAWQAERLDFLMSYLRSYAVDNKLLDTLALPLTLYLRPRRFGTLGIEVMSVFFLLGLLYPWSHRRRSMDLVAGTSVLGFVVWTQGSQQIRFLLPLLPGFSLLVAHVLMNVSNRLKQSRLSQWLMAGLVLTAVVVTLVVNAGIAIRLRFDSVVFGSESKDAFLSRVVYDYPALRYIRQHLPPDSTVLMLWDGQTYYCDERCIPDADQSRWTRLVNDADDLVELISKLRGMGVTHILLSRGDAEWMIQHDSTGRHRQAYDYYWQVFAPACTQIYYEDEQMILSKLVCK